MRIQAEQHLTRKQDKRFDEQTAHNSEVAARDREIAQLKAVVARLQARLWTLAELPPDDTDPDHDAPAGGSVPPKELANENQTPNETEPETPSDPVIEPDPVTPDPVTPSNDDAILGHE